MDVQILEKFQRSLVAFFDELVEMFPNEEFVYLRIMVKDRIPSTQIIKYFVKVSMDKEIMGSIERRDENFFLTNVLFSNFSKSDVFKKMWLTLEEDNKDMFWNWVDAFMKLTENYKKATS